MVSLSPSTVAFLKKCAPSTVQIDVLLLLCRDEERWWNAAQLGDELGMSESRVASALEALASCNLLDVRIGSAVGYRFAPVDASTRRAMTEAAASPDQARETVEQIARRLTSGP